MTNSSGRQPSRALLDSPWLSAALIVVVLAIIAAIFLVPGLLGPSGPGPSSAPSTGTPTASPSQPAPTFLRPTPSPLPTFSSYVVRSGDTLSSIARAFRTTARSIAWWNRGTYPTLDPESEGYEPDHLEVGWTLMIVPGTVVDENNPPTPSPAPGSTLGPVPTP